MPLQRHKITSPAAAIDHSIAGHLRRIAVLPMLLLGLLAVVYFPALQGPFVFDDTLHILNNPAIAVSEFDARQFWTAATSNRTDVLGRPLTTASFALSHYMAGGVTNTGPYKIAGLVIHILNSWLVYCLITLLVRKTPLLPPGPEVPSLAWIPAAATFLWALHPINLTSVVYVSQRATLLSALFVLAGLLVFTYARLRVEHAERSGYGLMAAGLLGGAAFGVVAKENAVLLPLYALVVEFTVFRLSGPRRGLLWFYGLTIVLPGAIVLVWLVTHPQIILGGYTWRHFSLGERLLTEPRVLWFYASLIFLPDIRRFSLYHDDIEISRGLVDPWTTLPALLALAAVTTLALWRARQYPVISFSILWFLAGHVLESSIIGLQIAHEHRNYLPSLGLIFGATIGVTRLAGRIPRAIIPGLFIGFAATLGALTHLRAQVWASESKIIEHMVTHHPASPSAHAVRAQLLLIKSGDVPYALTEYRKAADLAPHEASFLIMMAITAAETRVVSQTPPVSRGASSDDTGLRLLDPAIFIDIERRLAQSPISASTEAALRQLHDCLFAQPPGCTAISTHAAQWYRLAISNPRATLQGRGDVAIYLANLYLHQNRFAEALHLAREWTERQPRNPVYRLIEANAYLRLGRLDDAERAILLAKSSDQSALEDYLPQVDFLITELMKERERLRRENATKRRLNRT